jgi:uncharacterized RDD family membrane protein YckC
MEKNKTLNDPTKTNVLESADNEEYPRLATRFKAMIVDGFMIMIGFVLAGMIFSVFEAAPGYVRAIVFVTIVFLYEPILVSFGGTIGHRANGIMVKSNTNRNKNIFFLFALVRSAIKWFLGWISFVTMITNPEKRAIHDLLSNSIVLYKKIN